MSQQAKRRRPDQRGPRKQVNLTAQGACRRVQVLEVLQEADNVVACFAGHTHKVIPSSALKLGKKNSMAHVYFLNSYQDHTRVRN